MFTHHELMMLQATERRLERAAQKRRGGLVAAVRRAKRATPAAPVPQDPAPAPEPAPAGTRDPVPARARKKPAAHGRPAGTLTACAASGGQTQ